MNCIMFGLACDQEQFNKYIAEYGNPYSIAHFLFEKKLVEEIEKNFYVEHNYIFQSNNRSLRRAKIKQLIKPLSPKTKTTYLNYINLPIIKFFSLFFSTIIRILRYHKKYNGDYFILSTINYFPIAAATTFLSRILGYKNLIIFTDCSEGYAYDKRSNSFKDHLLNFYKKLVHSIEEKYDGYILFSEPMNELVNKKNKPFCVMEGFFNPDGLDLEPSYKFDRFTIVYAGTIIESVGLQNLIQAFRIINNSALELRIYGEGDYKSTLQQLAKDDNRIRFLGFLDHAEIFEVEKAASLMINVRDPSLAYTRYSFPSKTFEYLASGTPFLSTHLDCYLPEYDDHIYFIPDNDPQTIAQKLNNLSQIEKAELNNFGNAAREFVFNQKNSTSQVAKIISFIKEIHNDQASTSSK